MLHDYLQVSGGAERLVISLANGLDGFSLGVSGIYPGFLETGERSIMQPWVIGSPALRVLPRIPRALAAFGWGHSWLGNAECVIYSGLYAPLAVLGQPHGRRIYYCHTPPRFAFDLMETYLQRAPASLRQCLRLAISRYRSAYLTAIRAMDDVLVNSAHVRERLFLQTGIDARVVYPPIDTQHFRYLGQGDYYISLGRLEPNKRIDRIVQAFLNMPDKHLVVASGGSQLGALKALAGDARNIRFVGWLGEAELAHWVGHAIAALYVPKDEDFGMSAVEAMAAGKPIVAVNEGGLRESVIHGATGLLLDSDPSPEAIADAVKHLSGSVALAMRPACEHRANDFSLSRFISTFDAIVR
ncbi:glycosyltransferase [Pseudomonas stutzeri]|uniref:glycosyltransferase n=1 Tax=Stutzerimonas stutzeri TaxID=316 RepID=UPI0015E17A0A|nr:glycosyltransferase [Stutzerimonas stutzeri]MCQ4296215.1 glycosyltransferase [Stutzerimonas stutzeri]